MGEFSVALAAASKGKRCVQGVKICGFARVVNRARTPLRAPMGFELFISFLQYFEFHCVNSRRPHVATLLAFKSSLLMQTASFHILSVPALSKPRHELHQNNLLSGTQ